ncbi:MAG: hypothetical protein GF401_08560, partial [Chitinivibrionales bacterium]|nr:hypothetical protein [Chitinivibrionales bacterium]
MTAMPAKKRNIQSSIGKHKPLMATLLLVLTAGVFVSLWAAIGFDASSSGSSSSTNTCSWSHTIGSNDNRVLIVGASAADAGEGSTDNQVTSVTYNGTSMTKIADAGPAGGWGEDIEVSLWYAIESSLPASGGAYTIAVTYSGTNNNNACAAISLYDVAQQAPEANNSSSGLSGTPYSSFSTSVTTLTDGAWIVDAQTNKKGTGGYNTAVPSTGQQNEKEIVNTWAGVGMSTESKATAGSESMGWGSFSTNPELYGHVLAAFAPVTNNAPSVNLDSYSQGTGGNGQVTVQYDLSDADGDNCKLLIEYSYDNSTWYQAYISSASTGTVNNTGTGTGASTGQITGITTNRSNVTFVWDSDNAGNENGAFTGEDASVYIRVTPNDGTIDGTTQTSAAFTVDNQDPSVSTAVHFETDPPVAGTGFQLDAAFTDGNPNTNTFYYDLNGAGYDAGTAGDGNTANPSPVTLSVAVNGDDYFDAIRCIHVDDYGNSTTTEVTTDRCVKPYQPPAPTVDNATASTADVQVNEHASEASGLSYAMYVSPAVSGNNWVQTNGSVGASEAWQTAAAWGTVTVTGLSSPTTE